MKSHSTAPTSLGEGSSGPFTIGCLTCPSVPAVDATRLQRLTCHTSARFRVRAPGPYPTSYARRSAEVPIRCPGFLSPFGQPALASWASCSRHGLGSPYGRLTGSPQRLPDLDGVSTFPMRETRPGWAPSVPRGQRCSRDRQEVPGRRLPFFHGRALYLGSHPIIRGSQ
jgi:hypothetical protein